MKIRTILVAALFLFILVPSLSDAHPGRTDSSGGHYCRTNCSSWGEVYGQWHSHNGGYSYTPSYSVPTYNWNSDCPSYGFAYMGECYELPDNAKKSGLSGFTCNYGYDEVGYGLTKKCLKEVENGSRIGSTIFCDYGYQLSYSQCIKKNSSNSPYYATTNFSDFDYDFDLFNSCPKNSTADSANPDKCICNLGYEPNSDKDACKKITKKANDKICKAEFGKNSIWTGKYDKVEEAPTCKCKKNYEWNLKMTSCVKEK